jgi:hypothetical protein
MSNAKWIVTPLIVLVVGYFIVLPIFWPWMEPGARVSLPELWRHDADMPIRIRVTSAHPNIVVQEVRVTFDYAPEGDQGTPYPEILHSAQKTNNWTTWKVNRFTYPRSQDMEVSLPLARLAEEGKVKPGTLKGQVQVSLDYVSGVGRGHSLAGKTRGRSRMIATPYELTLE